MVKDIRVTTDDGRNIVGSIDVSAGERSWSFTPGAPWAMASILVDVSPTLEDVAANNFQDLLDHPASGVIKSRSVTRSIGLTACTD